MPVVKHIHQYYRKPNGIWHCSGYDSCTHYYPRNMGEPVGQLHKCWKCEEVFKLLPIHMGQDKPVCDTCSQELSDVGSWIEQKMKDMEQKNPYAAFPSKNPLKKIQERATKKEDQIEVTDPDPET